MSKIKVIYIRSLAYSGSTWLNLLLSSHPDAFCLGIGQFISKFNADTGKYACSVHGEACDFWPSYFKEGSIRQNAIFEIAKRSGKNIIVLNNPSKDFIQQNLIHPDIDVFALRIVRDGRANANSVLRYDGTQYEGLYHIFQSWMKPAWNNILTMPGDEFPSLFLKYEDFVTQSQKTLAKVEEFVGIQYPDNVERFWEFPHHFLNGNTGTISFLKDLKGIVRENEHSREAYYTRMLQDAKNGQYRPQLDLLWRRNYFREDLVAYEYCLGKSHIRFGYDTDNVSKDEIEQFRKKYNLPEDPEQARLTLDEDWVLHSEEEHRQSEPSISLLRKLFRAYVPAPIKRKIGDLISATAPNQFRDTTSHQKSTVEIPNFSTNILKNKPDVPKAIVPDDCERAFLRDLPPPFTSFVALSSDCDNGTKNPLKAQYELLKILIEDFSLPVTDSFFPQYLYQVGCEEPPKIGPATFVCRDGEFNLNLFQERNAAYYEAVQKGWFDTIHGWCSHLSIREAYDICIKLEQKTQILKVKFYPDTPWGMSGFYRYFCFNLQCNDEVSIKLNFTYDDNPVGDIFEKEFLNETDSIVQIDLWALSLSAQIIQEMDFIFTFQAREQTTVDISQIVLLSETSEGMNNHYAALCELDMNSSVFTSHDGGCVIGASELMKKRAGNGQVYSDHNDSQHYVMDLLNKVGVEYYTTRQSHFSYKPLHISDLIVEEKTSAEKPLLSAIRYMPHTNELDAISQADIARADFFNISLNKLIKDCKGKFAVGGIVYTHLISGTLNHPMRKEISPKTVMLNDVKEAFRELSKSFYGLTDPDQAIFVTPLFRLLKMSRAFQVLKERAVYNTVKNEIYISSFFDTVLERDYPLSSLPEKDLAGSTFYVNKSSTARVYVDDIEIQSLIRNSADDTGMESVTVCDNSRRIEVLKNDYSVQSEYEYFKKGDDLNLNLKDGFASLRLSNIEKNPNSLDFLEFEVENPHPSVRLHLEIDIEFDKATIVTLSISIGSEETYKNIWPLYQLSRMCDFELGVKKVNRYEFRARSKNAEKVIFKNISLISIREEKNVI